MAGKYGEIHAALQAIRYELPKDSGGNPLPAEQLRMEILDEGDDDRGDDEDAAPPVPVEDRHRTRRLRRGPVGAGSR